MNDIVERLRENIIADAYEARHIDSYSLAERLAFERKEAADKIERLRAALRPFAEAAHRYDPDEGDNLMEEWDWTPTIGMLRAARAVLEER